MGENHGLVGEFAVVDAINNFPRGMEVEAEGVVYSVADSVFPSIPGISCVAEIIDLVKIERQVRLADEAVVGQPAMAPDEAVVML